MAPADCVSIAWACGTGHDATRKRRAAGTDRDPRRGDIRGTAGPRPRRAWTSAAQAGDAARSAAGVCIQSHGPASLPALNPNLTSNGHA